MIIKTTLSKDLFIRLSLLRHIQRSTFYVYALLAAGITAYTLAQGRPGTFILLGWVPFTLYMLVGIFTTLRASRVADAPYFLPTEYKFTNDGISISSSQGHSKLGWEHIQDWRQMINTYVLVLEGEAILALPQEAVPPHQRADFEKLLRERVGQANGRRRTKDA